MKNSVKTSVCVSLLTVSVILSGCSVSNKQKNDDDSKDTSKTYSSNSIVSSSTNSNGSFSFDFIFNNNSSSNINDEMTMPNLIEMTLDQAQTLYPELKFNIERQYSTDYDAMVIMEQKTPAGRTIMKSTEITIVVSNGPQKIEIEDYSNLSSDDAKIKLEKAGLNPKIIYVENEEVSKGYVIKTEPAAHTQVEQGAEVKVYVSNGNTSSTNPEVYKKTEVADNQIIYIYGYFENAEEIFNAAKEIRKDYGYNVIIVSDTLGDDIGQDYADDLYDTLLAKENINNTDGFAFVIDFANRKWIISTCGKAIDEFENSSVYSYINDKFNGHEACELPMILLNEIKKAI